MKALVHPIVAAAVLATAQFCTVSGATRYVWLDNPNPTPPYTDWLTAATGIQDAVDIAEAGEEVLVTNGVYQTGARAVDGMSNRVAVTKPVTVRSVNGPAVTQIVGYQVPGTTNGPAAVRCVYLTNGAMLAGFTLTNGATQSDWRTNRSGGGALSSTLNNCALTANSADDGGGTGYSTLNNCTLTDNSAREFGGGAFFGTLNNCTLAGNSAGLAGGGAYEGTLNNCIVYYNSGGRLRDNYNGYGATLNYCCTRPLAPGTGNLVEEPSFVNTNGWNNLRLHTNSPCINAGNNVYAPSSTDADGNPRIVSGTVDMGAYEYQGAGSTISYAWLQHHGLPTDGSADTTDPDCDGLNTYQEWRCQTHPTDAGSVLRLLSATPAGNDVLVTWTSVAGMSYMLERSTDLGDSPRFTPLAANLPGSAGTNTFTDTDAAALPSVFYRVGVNPP